ncbi:nucleoside deaminase [Streptomyces sp. RLB3-17]|nr:nucleoside deaminase [Streptomyces sp. RLB3-17]
MAPSSVRRRRPALLRQHACTPRPSPDPPRRPDPRAHPRYGRTTEKRRLDQPAPSRTGAAHRRNHRCHYSSHRLRHGPRRPLRRRRSLHLHVSARPQSAHRTIGDQVPYVPQSQDDQAFLAQAIELSRHALEDEGKTPFGALVVIDGKVIATGTSSVVELRDPTAHAEVMALRAAGAELGRHLMEDAVMYASSEPCPMCLVACYWARIPRLVYAANSHDVAVNGFEDLQFYRQLALPNAERTLLAETAADGEAREIAAASLASWADKLPFPVEPKI